MPFFLLYIFNLVAERIEWGLTGAEGHKFYSHPVSFILEKLMSVCGKNHVGLWENSVNKVKCLIIPVSLWEKFGEHSIVLDNSRQFVGRIRLTKYSVG